MLALVLALILAAFFCASLAEGTDPAGSGSPEPVSESPASDPEQGHTDSHVTKDILHGNAQIAFKDDTYHTVTTVYDLYCEDCQRVIQESYKTVQIQQAHTMKEARQDPSCTMDGWTRMHCTDCAHTIPLETFPAPGHETPAEGWQQDVSPTCSTPGRETNVCGRCGETVQREIPATGKHRFAESSLLLGHGQGTVYGSDEYSGQVIGEVIAAPTCTEAGRGQMECLDCHSAYAAVILPATGHQWGPWTEDVQTPEEACTQDRTRSRTCAHCGETETESLSPAQGHQWVLAGMTDPTCTEDGSITRRCTACAAEETMVLPATGHTYAWVDKVVPSRAADGLQEYTCMVCGDVAESKVIPYEKMLYNNTITSFGPTTRELIGGNVWNRVTPLDLSQDGVLSYPLIASNRYMVGTATVTIDEGMQTVSYHLSSSQITVHSQSLVIYPNLDALRTGDGAAAFEFDTPIDLALHFGEDTRVILGITLKADYNTHGYGVQDFSPDKRQIEEMSALID